MKDKLLEYINDGIGYLYEMKKQSAEIKEIAKIIKNSNQIFVCGNGGSSATASHFTSDLQKMCGLRAFCLTDNTPLLTAWSNDTSYEHALENQLETLVDEDDLLIVISGSGYSNNITSVVEWALTHYIKVVAFVGMSGGLLNHATMEKVKGIHIESDMQHAEDWHLTLCHLIATLIKEDK